MLDNFPVGLIHLHFTFRLWTYYRHRANNGNLSKFRCRDFEVSKVQGHIVKRNEVVSQFWMQTDFSLSMWSCRFPFTKLQVFSTESVSFPPEQTHFVEPPNLMLYSKPLLSTWWTVVTVPSPSISERAGGKDGHLWHLIFPYFSIVPHVISNPSAHPW